VSEALEGVPGVRGAAVSLELGEARLTLDRPVDPADLDAALQHKGDYYLAEHDGRSGGTRAAPSGEQTGAARPSEAASAGHRSARASAGQSGEPQESLLPLVVIVAYILGAVVLIAASTGGWSVHAMMRHFMAGFFLVFSFFKMLDLRGFVDAYREYDLVAKAVPAWGWVYPFVELVLGIAYLTAFSLFATNVVTLVVMLVGAVGVFKALADKQKIRCACLGTVLNLPMTTVTLVEDLTMAAMAAAMLIL
jgi:hypothetical protein